MVYRMKQPFHPPFSKFQPFMLVSWPEKACICQNDEPNTYSNLQTKKKTILFGEKVHFLVKNRLSIQIENLVTQFLIFHNFRNLASFSHHFWIIQWMLQPLINNGIITIIKTKKALCTQTPCSQRCVRLFLFAWLPGLIENNSICWMTATTI